ncbi:serine/threonine protein kinase [Aphanomyces invadans]|uniref:Serine/threonine protein kinase n=2 Tax=Aphanomyces invadans TaxID=157072 RepID=A0A024U4J2_9STRA|nr:serine/threonine protein kinase [Aphanomyces invadans]ETW01169.1 serine/threonine protein kinase [Aphanomyces invadans]|eukprot:XP_008870167.1 serine/threonine protein kinase [Aphanomyces invadans]
MSSLTARLPLKAVTRLVRKRSASQPLLTCMKLAGKAGMDGESAQVLLVASAVMTAGGIAAAASSSDSSVSRSESLLSLPRYFDDEYDLVNARTLGQGAFGMVMQCVSKLDQTMAAVKVVSDGYDEAEREKNALMCVEHAGGHPNIIQLTNHFTHDGFHYMVLEFIDGVTLFDYVAERKQLTSQDAIAVLTQVASALAFLHAHGMVHCDLKPDNIMIVQDKRNESTNIAVKIIDFGSATIPRPKESSRIPLKRALTLSSAPLSGTRTYWSPEMLSGPIGQVSPSMDMWSLGCLLYIMLCGRHPFDSRGSLSEEMVLHNVIHADVDIPSSWPPKLTAIVAQLLDKDPSTRLTAPELVAALEALSR